MSESKLNPTNLEEHASFDILNCLTESVPDTDHELGFDVHERGWRVSLESHSGR